MKEQNRKKCDSGICTWCNQPNDRDAWYCSKCAKYYNDYRHKQRMAEKKLGICTICHTAKVVQDDVRGRTWSNCKECREKKLKERYERMRRKIENERNNNL